MYGLLAPIRARFADIIANMSARDRKLFVGLVVSGFVAALGGLWWIADEQLLSVQGSIDAQEHNLVLLNALAAEQASAGEQAQKIERQLTKFAGQDLPSFLEKAAEKTGVTTNLQGVREKSTTTEGNIEEHGYTVDLSKLSLQQLTEFLYEVETAGYPLKVRSMKTKAVTLAGVKTLSVTMEVSAFRLLEAKPETTEEKAG